MASEWPMCTAGEIAASTRNALVGGPFGSNLVSADYVEFGVPVIRGQNMGSRWVSGDFAFVSEKKALSLQSNLARSGDIVFTQRGTLGQVSLVPSGKFDKYLLSQSQMKLTPDKHRADSLFLYYVFSSEEQQDYVRQHAIQTGVPHTNLGILRDTPFFLPPLEEQHAIAHILGTLDDKIELNRRMNETLEAMARALFQSWFVDFDPVRAKAAVRREHPRWTDAEVCRAALPTLAREIAALFPDSFENSALGNIPRGWSLGILDEFAEHVLGGDWGGDEMTASNTVRVRCIRGADIPDLQRGGVGKMPDRYIKRSSAGKRTLNDGDLVIENSGGSPTQSTGRPVLISDQLLRRLDAPLVCSNFCRLIRLKSRPSAAFIYLWLLNFYANDEFLQFENGTTGIKNLAFTLFASTFSLVVPSPAVISMFAAQVEPLFLKLHANAAESESLAALRDTLLPKLISGELRLERK